jgi:uncharacterized Ntn-hydrolase superfamily protein
VTWSLLVHDPDTQTLAVAVTTCNLAVGASCPFTRAGVGAVSTQSLTNRYLGPAVLDGMGRGLSPAAAIEGALAGDEGRHLRQVHAVDTRGRAAAWTGRHCVTWAGARTATHWSVAGNMLAGEAVITDTAAAWLSRGDLPLPERMVAALQAGEAAGGDRRGRQSAALVLTTVEDFPDLDLRVDDHRAPLDELERLVRMWRAHRAPGLADQPRRANPSGLTDLDAIDARWAERGLDIRLTR